MRRAGPSQARTKGTHGGVDARRWRGLHRGRARRDRGARAAAGHLAHARRPGRHRPPRHPRVGRPVPTPDRRRAPRRRPGVGRADRGGVPEPRAVRDHRCRSLAGYGGPEARRWCCRTCSCSLRRAPTSRSSSPACAPAGVPAGRDRPGWIDRGRRRPGSRSWSASAIARRRPDGLMFGLRPGGLDRVRHRLVPPDARRRLRPEGKTDPACGSSASSVRGTRVASPAGVGQASAAYLRITNGTFDETRWSAPLRALPRRFTGRPTPTDDRQERTLDPRRPDRRRARRKS